MIICMRICFFSSFPAWYSSHPIQENCYESWIENVNLFYCTWNNFDRIYAYWEKHWNIQVNVIKLFCGNSSVIDIEFKLSSRRPTRYLAHTFNFRRYVKTFIRYHPLQLHLPKISWAWTNDSTSNPRVFAFFWYAGGCTENSLARK